MGKPGRRRGGLSHSVCKAPPTSAGALQIPSAGPWLLVQTPPRPDTNRPPSGSHDAPRSRDQGGRGGPMKIRVLVVDDFPLVREGLVASIEVDPDIEVVGEAADGDEGLELARQLR